MSSPRQAVPKSFPEDSTPSQSNLSQAGSSQASPAYSTLSLAESELSQASSSQSSPEHSTLQAESAVLPQVVRCSARLRASQARHPQAGNSSSWQASHLWWTAWSLNRTALFPRWHLPRPGLPRKPGLSPIGTTAHMVLTPWRNLTQSG